MGLEMLKVRWNDLKHLYENPSSKMEEPLLTDAASVQLIK
jgi:hypothetical protein